MTVRPALLLVAGCLATGGLSTLIAQTADGLDVAAIKRRADLQHADAEALAEQVRTRGDTFRRQADGLRVKAEAALRRVAAAGLPPGPAGPIDFDALVAGAGENASAPHGDAPQLIVFASLSMPPASLKPLIRETTRAGGVVVFRGFPGNSARAFTSALAGVIGAEPGAASIGIDPRLFRAFAVDSVPTVVVASTGFDLCAGFSCRTEPPPHDRLTGNVTLDYALSAFVDRQGPGARVAAVALARLRKPRP